MINSKKVRTLNSKQILLWNTIVSFKKPKSSQEIAQIINHDPGNIQRRLNKFKLVGVVDKEGSKYYVKMDNIQNLFHLIPKKYRLNQNNYKIELIYNNRTDMLNERISKTLVEIKNELISKMEHELSNELKRSKIDYKAISFDYLETEYEEVEFPALDVVEEDEEEIFFDLSVLRKFRENLPLIDEDKNDVIIGDVKIKEE